MGIERFEDIIAWQKAKELTVKIYHLFKASKDFGLMTKYSELQFL